MLTSRCLLLLLALATGLGAGRAASLPDAEAKNLDAYNVVWTTPSKDSSESMPCGGHDVGLNVWVENGELLFYMSRSGTFDENNTMLKLGRVRIKLTPNPFAAGGTFHQELKLKEGYIEIQGTSGAASATVKLWVEVGRPVVHVDVQGGEPMNLESWYETWRTADHPLSYNERMQCLSFLRTDPALIPLRTHADTIEPGPAQVLWYHRNDNTDLVFDKDVELENLESVKDKLTNPLKDLTFGGVMTGDDLASAGTTTGTYLSIPFTAWGLKSRSAKTSQSVRLYFYTAQAPSVADWKGGISKIVHADVPDDVAWKKNLDWWSDFWNRSYIFINPGQTNPTDPGWMVGKNYQIFRYTLGCNAYGEYPSKFNGSLFTWDAKLLTGKNGTCQPTPDFRAWGGGSFTAQNQRLVYWPMLKSGDFDMMTPQFEFYVRPLHNAEVASQTYWGHGGAMFTEQISNFGLPVGDGYDMSYGHRGLGPRPTPPDIGTMKNGFLSELFDTVLEFCQMILDAQLYSGQDINRYLPLINSCVDFQDEHYRYENKLLTGQEVDANGHLVLYPSSGNETYKHARNPANVIAALHTVLTSLLALPSTYGTTADRARWQRILNELPPLPFRDKEGHHVIAPAESWDRMNNKNGGAYNQDFSQMYPVFPWHMYGVGKPDLQTAIDTWHFGADSSAQMGVNGWHQSAIFVADLGLTDEAKTMVVTKLTDAKKQRFPTFWGPNFDYTPDFNHAGSAMSALQEMLLQTNGDKIYLEPAWPKDWDVDFKLHAPGQTTVSGQIRGGMLENQKVDPASQANRVSFGPPPQP